MKWLVLPSLLVALLLWGALFFFLPPLYGMESLLERLVFSGKCCCLAGLFCFMTGIEAIAHERFQSPAFDPLLGYETRRLKVNLRYLQNTLEQFIVFALGLFGLAIYCSDGKKMRAVAATTVVWIFARFAFWIGYHWGAKYRIFGIPGVAMSLIVLLFVSARIGFEAAGYGGAGFVLLSYLGIEVYLFRATRSNKA